MEQRRGLAVHAAVEQGLLCDAAQPVEAIGSDASALLAAVRSKPMALLYDADRWEENLRVLREDAFPGDRFLHACAVKTNPLAHFLGRAKALGHGAECASISEVELSLKVGFEPGSIVFDSPCKTAAEIEFALRKGVHLNMDNLQELSRVQQLVEQGVSPKPAAFVGIRVNPLVGAGTIAAFSVSTGKSKFGVPLAKDGHEREQLVRTVVDNKWINCVHVHTGSGGMGLGQLVMGVKTAVAFALEINKEAGEKQVKCIDIGGGLAVDFQSSEDISNFVAYAEAIRREVPEIFEKDTFDRIVTEFGAAAQCKFAFLASRVEYTKSYDGGRIALIHAGSDFFMRACYCPEMFIQHRVFTFDKDGKEKATKEGEEPLPHDIAGPLCFAGDVVVRDVKIPEVQVGDIIVLADAGGNSLSIHSTHCSRQSPPVYAFRISSPDEEVTFQRIQRIESIEGSISQWWDRP